MNEDKHVIILTVYSYNIFIVGIENIITFYQLNMWDLGNVL